MILAMLSHGLMITLLAATFVSSSGDPVHSVAVAPVDSAPVRVMVLGVWHFAGGTNVVEPEVVDVRTPEHQRQLEDIVESISSFDPTVVAVEIERVDQARLDSLYAAYRDGRHELAPSEQQQLGFRLAARHGHARLHAIDHKIPWPFDELLTYADEHEPWFVDWTERYQAETEARIDSLHRSASIREALRWYNEPERTEDLYGPYMRMVEVGADSSYAGVDPVANLYRRNLRIFANLTRIVERGDRVVVIYGAGHGPFLREFVEGHPHMALVDPLDYL